MRKFLFCLFTIFLLFLTFALVYNPKRYITACIEGLTIWIVAVLPSLLPFFFITLLITNLGIAGSLAKKCAPLTKLLYASGGEGAFVQIMSFISGYPVGARLVAQLYLDGSIDSKEATKISLFTSTSGPMFIIGSVGVGMFSSKTVGIILICSHFLATILNGIIFRGFNKRESLNALKLKKYSGNLLYDCAYSSTISCLIVGCFIAVFYVFFQILNDFNLISPIAHLFNILFQDEKKALGFCAGLIELTNGCILLSKSSDALSISLTAFLISFGGLSVIIQSISFLKQANVNIKTFIFSKLIQAITTFIICLIMCKVGL